MKKKQLNRRREEMFLAVDAGNSRTSFGLFRGGKFAGSVTVENREAGLSRAAAGLLSGEIIEMNGGLKADSCMMSSVVPSRYEFLLAVCRGACSSEPVFLSHEMDSGVKFNYEDISRLGLDRFAAAAACRKLYPGENVIIVDAGTAVTFGVLNKKGRFEGGLIFPGPRISAECLAEKTAVLPEVVIKRPASLIAANTADAIISGVFYGFIHTVDGLARQLKKELVLPAKVVAAGGWSGVLAEFSEEVDDTEPELVLKGMMVIHERSVKK